MKKKNLLYVDDERENLVVFRAAFSKNFNVLEASSAEEALDTLSRHDVSVLVADQRMPDRTGVELCEEVARLYPHTIRMILTGYIESDAMMDAINKGHVYNFITKPWERTSLLSTLMRGFEVHELTVSNTALLERVDHTDRCATLGRVAAGVAHEIRNQLFILPLVELLELKYTDDAELMQLAQAARQTHERLSELVTEVMDFVRKDETQRRPTVANLGDIVRETVSLAVMDDSIKRDCVNVSIESDVTFSCQKTKIQQVLFNLIKNASHAIVEKDGGAIDVTVQCTGGAAVIAVNDNGHGMAPDVLKRIWDPFFTTKGENGNGLGLDTCQRIVRSHNGTIVCDSKPGMGTRFTVTIPLDAPYKSPLSGSDITSGNRPGLPEGKSSLGQS